MYCFHSPSKLNHAAMKQGYSQWSQHILIRFKFRYTKHKTTMFTWTLSQPFLLCTSPLLIGGSVRLLLPLKSLQFPSPSGPVVISHQLMEQQLQSGLLKNMGIWPCNTTLEGPIWGLQVLCFFFSSLIPLSGTWGYRTPYSMLHFNDILLLLLPPCVSPPH